MGPHAPLAVMTPAINRTRDSPVSSLAISRTARSRESGLTMRRMPNNSGNTLSPRKPSLCRYRFPPDSTDNNKLPTTVARSGAFGLVRCSGHRSLSSAHSPVTCRNSIKKTAIPCTETDVRGSHATVSGPPGVCTVTVSGGTTEVGFSTSPSWWLDGDGKMAVMPTGYDLYPFPNCDREDYGQRPQLDSSISILSARACRQQARALLRVATDTPTARLAGNRSLSWPSPLSISST